MGQGTYVCGNCDRSLEAGRRWCPACQSTDVRFTSPEPSSIFETAPPRIIDDEAIWDADDRRPVFQRTHAPERRLHSMMEQSRWRRGSTTFGPAGRIIITVLLVLPVAFVWWVIDGAVGPVWATCFTLGVCGAWVVLARVVLKDVWSMDRVDASKMPLRAALRETRRTFEKARGEAGPFACGRCRTPRSPGATRCYKCSATHWIAV